MPIRMECCPAFNYARDKHDTSIIPDDSVPESAFTSPPTSPTNSVATSGIRADEPQKKALFRSPGLVLDLRFIAEGAPDDGTGAVRRPKPQLQLLDLAERGHLGKGVCCEMELVEGQAITFVLREPPSEAPPHSSRPTVDQANILGVPLQSLCGNSPAFALSYFAIDLISGASKLRSKDDPVLTEDLLKLLMKV
jgi:hypothetical protein